VNKIRLFLLGVVVVLAFAITIVGGEGPLWP
jgi:hypothetical protein